jgi:hypothetical protein
MIIPIKGRPDFRHVPEWGKPRRCPDPTADGGVKITYSQARTAPSRVRGKPVRASGKLIRDAGPRARPERAGAIVKYDRPAGVRRAAKSRHARPPSGKVRPHRARQGGDIRPTAPIIKNKLARAVASTPMCAAPWSTAAVIATTSRIRSVTVPPHDLGNDYHSC